MKFTNIIKLLSVLLCIFALFAACDFNEETTTATVETTEQITTETETEEETRGEIEPVLDNFFTFSDTDSWIELGEATRLDGTCVSKTSNNEIIVMRSAEVDVMNVVTETFTVYNTVLEKIVLTFKNTYNYDNYSAFDWNNIYVTDENVKYPASVMKVEVLTVSLNAPFIVKVSKATVTPTPESTLEENENANYYTINVNCEFYDVAGTKIVDTKYDCWPYRYGPMSNSDLQCLVIGNTNAFFDATSMELVKTVNSDNQSTIAGYHNETEKYGYFFGSHPSAQGHNVEYVQVYDKASSTCILTHYFDPAYDVKMFVLENGKIFVQIHNAVEDHVDLPYDYEIYENKYTVDSYLLDVKKDTLTEIECDFIVEDLVHVNETIAKDLETEGIKITDNIDNLALVRYIENGKVDYCKLAVIDNKFDVLFVLDRIVPEHNVTFGNNFGFTTIEDDNYLVELHNVVTSRAIVSKDGKVRCYLNAGDVVVGKYVVNQYGVFDYDMNPLFDFEENDLKLTTVIGDKIIVSKLIEIFKEPEINNEPENEIETGFGYETEGETEEETEAPAPILIDSYTSYYTMTVRDNGTFGYEKFYNVEKMKFERVGKDYVIFKNAENGKYMLFNVKLDHVLTTQDEMKITACEGKYIINTQLMVDGQIVDIFYTVGAIIAEQQ